MARLHLNASAIGNPADYAGSERHKIFGVRRLRTDLDQGPKGAVAAKWPSEMGAFTPLAEQTGTSQFDEDHPGARFLADHALQLEVCRGLLALADGLPKTADHNLTQRLIEIFNAAWLGHVRFQEEVICPLLKRRHGGGQWECAALFDRQHSEIRFANDELVETLRVAVSSGAASDALAYLLRHVSERRRDHIEAEHVLLLPVLREALAPIERKTYLEWAAANPLPFAGLALDS